MVNPMDREFGDDPFRRMEKLKMLRRKDRQSVDDFGDGMVVSTFERSNP